MRRGWSGASRCSSSADIASRRSCSILSRPGGACSFGSAAISAAAGMVTIQATTMLPAMPQRTARARCAEPTPTILDRVKEGRGFRGAVIPTNYRTLHPDEEDSPQHAVGGIWRARRVLAVGDPLQLEPVATAPRKLVGDIAATWGVSSDWIPPLASVQTLDDRVTRHGTTLPQGENDVWVGSPLRVLTALSESPQSCSSKFPRSRG